MKGLKTKSECTNYNKNLKDNTAKTLDYSKNNSEKPEKSSKKEKKNSPTKKPNTKRIYK